MFILDASVTLAWGLQDEESDYAEMVLESLETDTAIIPALWVSEITNILSVSIKRKRLSEEDALSFLDYLENLSISIDEFKSGTHDLFRLGKQYGLTTYDATYLQLSLFKNLPLATLDKAMRTAAQQAGVPLYLGPNYMQGMQ